MSAAGFRAPGSPEDVRRALQRLHELIVAAGARREFNAILHVLPEPLPDRPIGDVEVVETAITYGVAAMSDRALTAFQELEQALGAPHVLYGCRWCVDAAGRIRVVKPKTEFVVQGDAEEAS